MHVGIDEACDKGGAANINNLTSVSRPPASNHAIGNGEVS
jgi:hypothetical protein